MCVAHTVLDMDVDMDLVLLAFAVIKGIVELHRGTVRAVSEGENLGCTFILDLPVKRVIPNPIASLDHLDEITSTALAGSGPPTRPLRINSWLSGDADRDRGTVRIMEELTDSSRPHPLLHKSPPASVELRHQDFVRGLRQLSRQSALSVESFSDRDGQDTFGGGGLMWRKVSRLSSEDESPVPCIHRRSALGMRDLSESSSHTRAAVTDEFSLSALYTSREDEHESHAEATARFGSGAGVKPRVTVGAELTSGERLLCPCDTYAEGTASGGNAHKRHPATRRRMVRWLSLSSFSSSSSNHHRSDPNALAIHSRGSVTNPSILGSNVTKFRRLSGSGISMVYPAAAKDVNNSLSKGDWSPSDFKRQDALDLADHVHCSDSEDGLPAAPRQVSYEVHPNSIRDYSPGGEADRDDSASVPDHGTDMGTFRSTGAVSDDGRGAHCHPGHPTETVGHVSGSKDPVRLRKVLIVDDSVINRKMMVRMLRRRADVCDEAGDGKQAVQMYMDAKNRGDSYDVILLDYMMPVMDGAAAAKELRSLGYLGPLIGITGNALPCDLVKFLESGLNDVLTKPFDIDVFDQLLRGKSNCTRFSVDILLLSCSSTVWSLIGELMCAPV